jgi:Leucine-rich repeat (LRR) protein
MLPSLISLTDLRFDNNRIASLPPEMASLQMLQILSFQNNIVDSIPPSFSSLHRLAFLRCGSNKITDVRSTVEARDKCDVSLTRSPARFISTCAR